MKNIYNQDALIGMKSLNDKSIDLIIVDPPYGLGKDYGNNSDKLPPEEFLNWTYQWLDLAISKLKDSGSLYIFTTWRYSPEIFLFLKSRMIMLNEIIWDRKVPSMGGSIRRFSSVHDTIGFFAKTSKYYFNLDAVRIPYDEKTKHQRSRAEFVGKKWLELGYNPKDIWSFARLHGQHPERENHPTQKPIKIIERMILASCPENGIVLDPFAGSGTTAIACINTNRHYICYEINTEYYNLINQRISKLKENNES